MTSVVDDFVRGFDHTSAEHSADPYARYRRLRSGCPVGRSEQHDGFWVISRHEHIEEIEREHLTFSSASVSIPEVNLPVPGIPTESDEPRHTHYRRTVMPFLMPGAVAALESEVRAIVCGQIDGFATAGEAEMMDALAKPVPAKVIARFFGLSPRDGVRCHDWFEAMLSLSVTDRESAEGAGVEFFGFLQGLIDQARAEPSDDVVSAIVTALPDGEPFSARECLGLVFTTLTGALETTVSTIGSAVHVLATHPEVRRRLRAEPVLLPRAVEEFLRMASPVQAFARTVTRDVDFHGHDMRAGDRVLLLYGSGNYDDERFPDPDRFDLERGRNPHLTFGHGIHKCAGQHLARLEIRVVVQELLARIPEFELVSAAGPHMRGGVTWGFDEVRIRFPAAR